MSLRVAIGPAPPLLGNARAVEADTDCSFKFFIDCLKDDRRLCGRVLDVGSGEWPGVLTVTALLPLYQMPASLDGLDPFPGVKDHPWLENAWHGEIEQLNLPSEAYDAAVAINVVEHIARPAEFLRAVCRVLKPGGVFYAITPHACHPFAWSVRLIQALRVKKRIAASDETINDYPAYYRLNSRSAVARFGSEAGFERGSVFYHPHASWRRHLPGLLKPVGWMYDQAVGMRVLRAGNQFMLKLEKPGDIAGKNPPPRTSKVRYLDWRLSSRAEVPRHAPAELQRTNNGTRTQHAQSSERSSV
jgi:SAM-dependent methyltransferase